MDYQGGTSASRGEAEEVGLFIFGHPYSSVVNSIPGSGLNHSS